MALSKFTVRDTVLVTKAQDEHEFQQGVIVQSLTTEQGDFVHLVVVHSRATVMYEEKDLAHV